MPNPYYNVLTAMKGAKTSASSALGSFDSWYAIDGSGSSFITNSRWVSNVGTVGEWLQVDLPRLAVINKFILYTGNSTDGIVITGNAIRNVDFQVRQNGQWVTVGQARNNSLTNPKITAQLDKAYLTDGVRLYFPIAEDNFRVFELEAYGRIIGKAAQGLTSKNLLLPFTNPNWNYTRPVVSVTPRKLVLDMDGSRTNELVIPAKPNTTYTLSGKTDLGRVYFVQRVGSSDKGGTGYSNYGTFSRTVTTGSDVNGLRISMTTDNAGIITYEDVMLVEGSTAQPYERYRPVPKTALFVGTRKNLIPTGRRTVLFSTTASISGGQAASVIERNLPVKPNTTYTLSFNSDFAAPFKVITTQVPVISGSHNEYYSNGTGAAYGKGREITVGANKTLTFTTTANEYFVGITTGNSQAGAFPISFNMDSIQLEEGSVKTPYADYKGLNKTANIFPKKNWFDKKTMTFERGAFQNGALYDSIMFSVRTKNKVPVKPNTTYIFNKPVAAFTFIQPYSYDKDGNYLGRTAWAINGQNYTFTTDSKTAYVNLQYNNNTAGYVVNAADLLAFNEQTQVEVGTTQTAYEAYKLIAKPAVLTQPKKNLFKPFATAEYYTPPTSVGRYTITKPYRMDLNANATHQYLRFPFTVKQNTDYTFTVDHNATIGIYGDDGTTALAAYTSNKTLTFNSGSWKTVRIYFTNIYKADVGQYYFENPQLEEGKTATPFTPYVLRAKDAKY